MENCDIDVSGDYPAEMMPKLVETARKIADSGSCGECYCHKCPASLEGGELHRGCRNSSGRGRNSSLGPVENPAWFRAFVERYGEKAPQGHHNIEITDRVCGTPRVGNIPTAIATLSDFINGTPQVSKLSRPVAFVLDGQSIPIPRVVTESTAARRKRMLHADKKAHTRVRDDLY